MNLDDETKYILAECYKSVKSFGKVFFPELFYAPFSPLHDQIFDLIDSGAPRIAIAAPRGLGKTTIARTVAARGILYKDCHFIPYVSNSATLAEMQTENLKSDLRTAKNIRDLFGDIKISDIVDESGETLGSDTFSKLSWVAYGSTLILPRGQGQQIRGLNWLSHRPDLMIIDDLEKKEELQNEDLRLKLKRWFYGDLMKCIDRYSKKFQFIYIDTLKHEDSLLQELLDSSDWESLCLELCDDTLESNAPSYMTTDEIKAEFKAHEEKGQAEVFHMEYRNKVTGGSFNSFKKEYFKHYNEDEIQGIANELETIVIYDPAKTVNPLSAETGIIGVSLHAKTARIFIRDAISDKLHPDDQYASAFDMADKLNAKVVGIEVTGLNEFITKPFRDFMMSRGTFYEIVELKARGGSGRVESKPQRIKSLIPYYRQGNIYHNITCCAKLEGQLLSFPFSKLWDLMDAEAYLVEMFSLGNRDFAPQNFKDGKSEDPDEDEYAELEASYEPALDWGRQICP
jgi:hypothetical protein